MRIFYSFLIVFTAAILILIPVTSATYDFRTDLREDNITAITGPASTNTTVQLLKPIYDDDTSTLSLSSNDTTETPYMSSYNATTRAVLVAGLSTNTTRTITAEYDVDALTNSTALATFLSYIPFIWIILWIALPLAGLIAIWTGKAN